MLTNFNPNGHGGMDENIQAAGRILEDAKFPPLKNMLCCVPCTGEFTFTPNESWVNRCIYRIKVYLCGSIVTVIVTQVLEDQNLLFHADGTPKLADRLVNITGIVFVLFGVSGFMSLRGLLMPLVLPRHREHVYARAILSVFFFTWIGGVQNALFSALGLHQNTSYAVINVEMLFFQIACHKYYVPTFSWWFDPPDFYSDEDSVQKLSDFEFLIPIQDMAATATRKFKENKNTIGGLKTGYDLASSTAPEVDPELSDLEKCESVENL
jgi:hypothetical protein